MRTTDPTAQAELERRLVAAAARTRRQLPDQKVSLKAALQQLASLTYHHKYSPTPALTQARSELTAAVLAHPSPTAAAARKQLVVDGSEPRPPHPGSTDLLTYVHHAWLNAHAELSSPRRWARLAGNRWVRAQDNPNPIHRRCAAEQVRAALPGWEDQLNALAAALPTGPHELDVSANGARRTGAVWGQSSPRPTLLHTLLSGAFGDPDRHPLARVQVISGRSGGRFTLVAPAPWTWWLTGPVLGFTVQAGGPVSPEEVPRHRLALRIWDRGTGIPYADAYQLAGGVLQEPARGR